MKPVFLILYHFISQKTNGLKSLGKSFINEEDGQTSSSNRASTYVINHEFCSSCLSEEDQRATKGTLGEVHTYAQLENDPRASLPSSFTICSAVMTTYGDSQRFFSLLGKDGNVWLESQLFTNDGRTQFWHWKFADRFLPPVFAHQWVRGCTAVNTESGLLQWVVDGILVENSIFAQITDSSKIPTDLIGKIVLGAAQHWTTSKWGFVKSNQVTNLNIFSTALPMEVMTQITKGGSCNMRGDYLSWEEMRWKLHGQAVRETVDVDLSCMEDPSMNYYSAAFSPVESCLHFCQKFGSRVPPSVTMEQWAKLQTFFEVAFNNDKYVKGFWLALVDNKREGEWEDYYNHELVNFTIPWAENEPDGGNIENCARIRVYKGTTNIADRPCSLWPYACLCERDPLPYLRLRGLCSESSVQDTLYQPQNNLTDFSKLTLVSVKTSINHNHADDIWALTDAESNVTGISRAAHTSFTLGRHNWTIRGDKGCSKDGEEYTIELKMSGCQDGNFTCDDGQCVSMDQRCDQLPDCLDKSDEENCNILHLEKSYNKNVPPIISRNERVNVLISINLLKLVDIREEDYSIDIQFSILLEWQENRATYHNLKPEKSLNSLRTVDIDQLWLPRVVYENTDQQETTRLGEFGNGEWETRIVVNRQGNFTRTELNVVDEIEIFNGASNSLLMSQTYTHEFQCAYDFSMYPFDTQVTRSFESL